MTRMKEETIDSNREDSEGIFETIYLFDLKSL
jgi:hypothetical protein